MAGSRVRWRLQRGYLREIPVAVLILVAVTSLVLPRLPSIGRKIVIAAMTVPLGYCLYYMLIAPGWLPGTGQRRVGAWRILLFLGCCALLIAGVGAFLLR